MFFMKAGPVYEISQQYQPTKLTCLTNVTMKSSYRRQNTINVLQEEGLLWHSSSSSCNIWPLFYFIDLQCLYIPCLPLLIFSMTSCNVKLYLFLSMAFVADVIKNMYRYMVHWYIIYVYMILTMLTNCFVGSAVRSERFFLMFLAHLN